jgi:hypothetical protein
VHGDHDIWIIGGHHHAGQIAADISKVARVTRLISVYLHGIEDD